MLGELPRDSDVIVNLGRRESRRGHSTSDQTISFIVNFVSLASRSNRVLLLRFLRHFAFNI